MKYGKIKSGFTIVEVIIVISIIAILSTVTVAGVGQIRAKGRDAKRKTGMQKVKMGVENFYTQYKFYPNPGVNKDDNTGIDDTEYGFRCSPENDQQIMGFMSVNKCLSYMGFSDLVDKVPKATISKPEFNWRYVVDNYIDKYEISAVLETGGSAMYRDCTEEDVKCDNDRYEVGKEVSKVDSSQKNYVFNLFDEGLPIYVDSEE